MNKIAELDAIKSRIINEMKCPLKDAAKNLVFGKGNPDASIMFIGEAPGAQEDELGIPFVGAAGKELDKLLRSINLTLDDVYIANIVKCQPPGNRTPLPDEIDTCAPYLLRQLEVIQPAIIVALGSVAANYFVPGDMKISSLRGTFYDFQGIKVMPTFHPSYLVRNEGNRKLKKDVWDDMQKVMALLGKK